MSAAEVGWRAASRVRQLGTRLTSSSNGRTPSLGEVLECETGKPVWRGEVLDPHLCAHRARFTDDQADRWLERLTQQADRIAAHRLDLFDLIDLDLGPTINWNFEHKAGRPTPLAPASTIDYRDYRVSGDCKFVWELNRHHQLVVLARAYYATGNERYSEEVFNRIESWVSQCPAGYGMNWRSPLELSIRLINWMWSLHLASASQAFARRWTGLLPTIHQHLATITRSYSRYSSANNHLIGEAAGVFITCSCLPTLRRASVWRKQARAILLREIIRQTHEDGCTREQAFGYQLFVMEFFLLCGVVARNAGDDFPPHFWRRLERMFEFLQAMTEGGDLPNVGDADDGYVLDLGDREHRVRAALDVASGLFHRTAWAAPASDTETAFWLLGHQGRAAVVCDAERSLSSRAFPQSGYYLLQRGHGRDDGVSVLFDCGPLGYLSTAAHGHADALAVTLRVAGVDVLVDPGTYDYFTYPQWRAYFRSTLAHNTVVVDGLDSSEQLGPFLWGRRAACRCLRWAPTPAGGVVCGEHDGYAWLSDSVIHRRTVSLADEGDELLIEDELICQARHDVALYWHVGPACGVHPRDRAFLIRFAGRCVGLETDALLTSHVLTGSSEPIGGWISRGYHRKSPATTIVSTALIKGTTTFASRFRLLPTDMAPTGLTGGRRNQTGTPLQTGAVS